MDLIVHYLEIQQIKTPELFTYELDILDSLKECPILKMLLQPLVENSVIHGFMDYKNNRKIAIKAFLVDSDIIVVVSDDGRSMTQNQANNVFSPPAAAIPKSFGLRNVHSRIQLKFGCEFGLQVSSKAGVGTTVTVKYPKYSQ